MLYLLDTNMCIRAMRSDAQVVPKLQSLRPDYCAISLITSYELRTGVAKCSRPEQEEQKVSLLLQQVHELPFDQTAAVMAGAIRAELESLGQMIGPYDVLIAAQAIVNKLSLISSNLREFNRVRGLACESW